MFVFKWLFSLKFIKFGLKFDNNISKWIFNLAWPLGLVFIVNNLFFKIDTIMLFVIKGPDAVGVYGVAYKVLEVTIFIGGYFASSLKPTISKNIHSSKSYVGDLIQKSFIIMLFFSLPITVICIAFSKDIIIFLSNAEFIAGAKALIILALTLPLIYLDVLLGEILIANDERKLMIRISIFALLFNFIANLIFIPLYSLYGAAFTTLLSELVLLLINYHYTKKILGYHLNYKKIFRIIMISIICLLLGYVIRETKINFLILSAFILIVYAFLSQIFDIVTLKTVRQLINR